MTIAKPTWIEKIKWIMESPFFVKRQIAASQESCCILALLIMTLNIPILIFGYYPATDYVNIIVQYSRYLLLFLAVVLMLHELFNIKHPMILYHITLFFVFPFFSTYMLTSSDYKLLWWVNCILSIMTLFLFTHLLYGTVLSILGIITAVVFYKIAHWMEGYKILSQESIDVRYFSLYSIVILIVMMAYVVIRKQKENKKLHQSLRALVHSVIQDVNASLITNSENAESIEQALNEKDYDKVYKHIEGMRASNMVKKREIRILWHTMNYHPDNKPNDWDEYSVRECIQNTLRHFIMDEEEEKRISFIDMNNQEKDFIFTGSETLFRYVLFNLIQNTFVHAGDRAKIKIFIQDNKVYVEDNGFGILPFIYDELFEKYTAKVGHGLGLHFCKQAMLKMNGDIQCISEYGEGTQFILSFKKADLIQ